MHRTAFIGLGVVLLVILLGFVHKNMWSPGVERLPGGPNAIRTGPMVEIEGKGHGTDDLTWLATGKTNWEFSPPGYSERSIVFPQAVDFRPYSALEVPFQLRGGTIGVVRLKARFVHHNGWIYETCREVALHYGDRGTLKVDLQPSSTELIPIGHARPWDLESARAIKRVALVLYSEGFAKAQLEVGTPKLVDIEPVAQTETKLDGPPSAPSAYRAASWPPADLKLLDLRAEAAEGRMDVLFRLSPPPPDPFDSDRCDLRVLLVSSKDSQLTLRLEKGGAAPKEILAQARPAFYDQDYFVDERALDPCDELKPIELPHFAARLPWGMGLWPMSKGAQDADDTHGPEAHATAVIFVNGRVFVKASVELPPTPASSAHEAHETVTSAPAWSVAGGERFCELYRPRTELTGMPWRNEVARYIGTSTATPADKTVPWSYAPCPERVPCWLAPIEWNSAWGKWLGLGQYDLEMCWRFDRVLERATKENVRLPLLLTSDDMFFNHGKYRWPMNPLSKESGGPIAGPGQFFGDTLGRSYIRKRLRYLSARYGASPALEGWLFGATLPTDSVPDWHREMAALLKSVDESSGWYDPHRVRITEGVPEPSKDSRDNAPRLAHATLSLHPWTTEFDKLSRKNSFEPGTDDFENWHAEQRLCPGTLKAPSRDLASDGKYSVALRGKMPGAVCLVRELIFKDAEKDNFYDFHTLIFDAYVPADAPHDMRAVVHLRDRDELWYEALLDPLIRPGEWTRLVLDVTGDNAHGLKPVNHLRPWDDYSRTRLREIGIRIFCAKPYAGSINIDNIHFAGAQLGRVAPKVVPVVAARNQPPAQLPCFDKWELDFDLNKSYPNPYDPEVIDVSARISTPGGQEVVVPAFFYEAYDRRLVRQKVPQDDDGYDAEHMADVEEIVPVGGGTRGFWKLRYAPQLEGEHTVVIEVREGGKWHKIKEEWIADDRFTADGEPLPADRQWHGDFTQIPRRADGARRRIQDLEYIPGELVAKSQPIKLTATKAKVHGFVHPSKDPRYLEYSDGTFHYPIGMNLATPSEWQLPLNGGVWAPPEGWRKLHDANCRGTFQYDDYFASFQKQGMNWAKLWMATWWTAMEWRRDWPPYQGAGRYSQPNAWRMDYLVEAARAKGIFLQVILMNHGQISSGINHNWEHNPYNEELGGPVHSAREFYSDYNAKRLFKNKLRYIAARWGYSTSIQDWTLCGEMDFTEEYQTNGGNGRNGFDLYIPANDPPAPATMINWLDEMGTYMRSIDQGKHLIGTHVSHPQRGVNIHKTQVLDYVQSNAYSGFPWLANGSMNAIRAISAYYYGQTGQNHFCGMGAFGKPVLICEQGGFWHGTTPKYGITPNTPESLDADLHCGLWSGILSPMAGQTGYWWWMHIHFDGGYEHFTGAVKFMKGEDLRGLNFHRSKPEVNAGGKAVDGLAFHNDKRGFAWIFDQNMPFRLSTHRYVGVTAHVSGVEDGSYDVEYWNTMSGEILLNQKIETIEKLDAPGYVLPLALPPFDGDVAVKFKKNQDAITHIRAPKVGEEKRGPENSKDNKDGKDSKDSKDSKD